MDGDDVSSTRADDGLGKGMGSLHKRLQNRVTLSRRMCRGPFDPPFNQERLLQLEPGYQTGCYIWGAWMGELQEGGDAVKPGGVGFAWLGWVLG